MQILRGVTNIISYTFAYNVNVLTLIQHLIILLATDSLTGIVLNRFKFYATSSITWIIIDYITVI